MQGRECDHVLVFLALGEGGKQGDGLRDFEQVFHFVARAHARCVVNLATTALCHPVTKLHDVVPLRGGGFFAFLAVVQVLLVVDVFEPIGQKRTCIFCAGGQAGTEFEVIHIAAKLVQAA